MGFTIHQPWIKGGSLLRWPRGIMGFMRAFRNLQEKFSTAIATFNFQPRFVISASNSNRLFHRLTTISTFNRDSVFQRSTAIATSNRDSNFQPRFDFLTLNCDSSFQPRFKFSTLNCDCNFQPRFRFSTGIQTWVCIFNVRL